MHLGLKGVSEELLETFPVDNLVEKSDSDTCVVFYFSHSQDVKADFVSLRPVIAKILHVELDSVELSKKDDCELEAHIFYNSHSTHWSEHADADFDELCSALYPYHVKINLNVSINN